jgi:hypothetical protein
MIPLLLEFQRTLLILLKSCCNEAPTISLDVLCFTRQRSRIPGANKLAGANKCCRNLKSNRISIFESFFNSDENNSGDDFNQHTFLQFLLFSSVLHHKQLIEVLAAFMASILPRRAKAFFQSILPVSIYRRLQRTGTTDKKQLLILTSRDKNVNINQTHQLSV